MAQVIAPEVWQRGIDDPKKLPSKVSAPLFTGKGVPIANNGEACRVWDIQIPDFVTTYDDRRVNGLANIGANPEGYNVDGKDGWGASAWGPMQDVRFDSRVYAMGRHRSVAFRIFDEKQYSGGIGTFANADGTKSTYSHGGNALMNTAQIISEIKSKYEERVMGVDMDKYNIFAILNGHMTGRLVGNSQAYEDKVFDGDCRHYSWVAQPGTVQGQDLQPSFAPIHGIKIDFDNLPLFLSQLETAWTSVGIDKNDCKICIDNAYRYYFLKIFTGDGVPATANAYQDLQDGRFEKLLGFTFDFTVPTQYYPTLYFDANLNVVHSANGQAAYDRVINSIAGQLVDQLIASHRMGVNNFVRTIWDNTNKKFKKVVTNYPLGDVAAANASFGTSSYVHEPVEIPIENYGKPETYPWARGAGIGLPPYDPTAESHVGTATGPIGPITAKKVVGMAVYSKAAQLSQEYKEMRTEDGGTRGKFTEMVMDVKYDAWVIESLSCGILPIIGIDTGEKRGIPVQMVGDVAVKNAQVEDSEGQLVDKPVKVDGTAEVTGEVDATVTPAEGATFDVTATPAEGSVSQVKVTNSTAEPVNTKEVTESANKAKKKN